MKLNKIMEKAKLRKKSTKKTSKNIKRKINSNLKNKNLN